MLARLLITSLLATLTLLPLACAPVEDEELAGSEEALATDPALRKLQTDYIDVSDDNRSAIRLGHGSFLGRYSHQARPAASLRAVRFEIEKPGRYPIAVLPLESAAEPEVFVVDGAFEKLLATVKSTPAARIAQVEVDFPKAGPHWFLFRNQTASNGSFHLAFDTKVGEAGGPGARRDGFPNGPAVLPPAEPAKLARVRATGRATVRLSRFATEETADVTAVFGRTADKVIITTTFEGAGVDSLACMGPCIGMGSPDVLDWTVPLEANADGVLTGQMTRARLTLFVTVTGTEVRLQFAGGVPDPKHPGQKPDANGYGSVPLP